MLDNFREWLSDNLRYILLGLAILIVLVILFFGIKAITGGFSDKEGKEPAQKTEQEKESEKTGESEGDTSDKDSGNALAKDDHFGRSVLYCLGTERCCQNERINGCF